MDAYREYMAVDPLPRIPNGIELRRLLAFAAVVTYGRVQAAADALGMTKEGVAKPVRELQKAFGDRPLTETQDDRVVPTALGTAVHQVALDILNRAESLRHLSQHTKPVTTLAYLPHHAEFVAPMLAAAGDDDHLIDFQVLEDEHRAAEVFQQVVIGRLNRGVYDVVIGPPPTPERGHNLYSKPLYRCCMVALVNSTEPDEMSFAEAASRPLLLPPADTRAGLAIRGALDLAAPGDTESLNIVQAAHSATVLVVSARAGLGTVILPGDIAFSYSPNGSLHGWNLRHLKWVPLRDSAQNLLTHTVYATVRRRSQTDLGVTNVLQALTLHARKRLPSPNIELL